MSDEIERIRRDHIADPDGDPNDPHCVMCSDASYPIWPCDAAILLALLAERDAEVARLRVALDLLTWFGMDGELCWCPSDWQWSDHHERCDKVRAALAARGGEDRP